MLCFLRDLRQEHCNGDTAWQLFARFTREEADYYLENRARKGFTVIQAVVLSEITSIDEPNAYGELPLSDVERMIPNGTKRWTIQARFR